MPVVTAAEVTWSAAAFRRAGFVGGGQMLWLQGAADEPDVLAAFGEAIAASNEVMAEAERDELHAQVDSPAPTPVGPMALVQDCEPAEAMTAMLDLVARALEARGVSGVLRPAAWVDNPVFDSQVFTCLGAMLLLPVDVPAMLASYDAHARKPTDVGWHVEPAVTERVLRRLLDWVLAGDGLVHVTVANQLVLDPGAVTDFVLRTVPQVRTLTVRRSAEGTRLRGLRTSENGCVSLQSYDPAVPRADHLAALQALLREVSGDLSAGFVRETRTNDKDRQSNLQRMPPTVPVLEVLQRNYWLLSHLEGEYVYDAFVSQVMTDAQLARTGDLAGGGWSVDDLANGHHLVTHPLPDVWFDTDPTPLEERAAREAAVPPDVLERARDELGEAILTVRIVAEHPPPLPGDAQEAALRAVGLDPASRAAPTVVRKVLRGSVPREPS
jgi:hypothetical protein